MDWKSLGPPHASISQATDLSIAINGGIYLAYKDAAVHYKLTVRRFEEGDWLDVERAGFSQGFVNYISLTLDEEGPMVAFQDVEQDHSVTVMRFDREASRWLIIGKPGFSEGYAHSVCLAQDRGTPYVAFQDVRHHNKASVMTFNGARWDYVGKPGFSDYFVNYTQLQIVNGTPYVAFEEESDVRKASVMKFDGNAWQYLGNRDFSSQNVRAVSLCVYPLSTFTESVAVAWQDTLKNDQISVMTLKGRQWQSLSSPSQPSAFGYYPCLIMHNDSLHLACQDLMHHGRASVRRFTGYNWEPVGQLGFSRGRVSDLSFASDGERLYLAYRDEAEGHKAVVMVWV